MPLHDALHLELTKMIEKGGRTGRPFSLRRVLTGKLQAASECIARQSG